MFTYLTNILPRLKQLSKSLDEQELYLEQPWVKIDEHGNTETYIFTRDGRLIMSLNGKAKTGKWEYLAAAKKLWISRGVDDEILLDHAFIDPAIMILKLDGNDSIPFILSNKKLLPSLKSEEDIERYLQGLTQKAIPINTKNNTVGEIAQNVAKKLHYTILKTDKGELQLYSELSVGIKVYINGEIAQDGIYTCEESGNLIRVTSGRIDSIKQDSSEFDSFKIAVFLVVLLFIFVVLTLLIKYH